MFFTMLKNDLKAHKGLNIILFIFIVCSSIISVVAANLMYMEMTGSNTTNKAINFANITVNCSVGMGNFEEKGKALEEWIDDSDLVKKGEIKEYISLIDDEVRVNGKLASDDTFPNHRTFHLTIQNRKFNLLYNDEDKPFALDTGEIAISINIADMAGIKRGDVIRITSQMGNVFEFKVAEIYKNYSYIPCEELVISDVDFNALHSEFPFRLYKLLLDSKDRSYGNRIAGSLYDNKIIKQESHWSYLYASDDDYIALTAVSYFLVVMSITILLIMFITVRFMMQAAIKQEEKEIGMMRAIGVDSWKYRWMFASVYIVFALFGGISGLLAGVPISRKVIRLLCKNMIIKDKNTVIYIALGVSFLLIVAIILFATLMMRRINKISVIETIHGGSDGERFEKLNKLNLYNSKRFKVPTFLAVGNIINSFKKYIFLIITYTMAIMVLLTTFYVKSSLISPFYYKTFMMYRFDFSFYFRDDLGSYYFQKGGSYEGAYKLMAEDANEAGIPVKFRYINMQNVDIKYEDGDTQMAGFYFGDTYNDGIRLRKGGKLPIHENEILVSYYSAKNKGIKIGDTLTIVLDEYDDDNIGTHEVEREFIVTGFFDALEQGTPYIVVGKEYTGAESEDTYITDLWFDAPKSELKKNIQRMKDKFGEEYVESFEDVAKHNFSYIISYIDALKIILSIMLAFILSLNTLLYTTVDLAKETPAVATLKCIGFSDKDVRKWQMVRMMIILVIGYILANVLEETVGNAFASKVFETFGTTGFRFVPDPIDKYLIVPLIIFSIVIVALRVCLKKVKNINIWNIREE